MFIPHTHELADSPAAEQIKAGAITVKIGTALYFTGGKAAIATGANKPTHISMSACTAADGDLIPAIRVRDDTVFESRLSVNSNSIAIGAKYTIDAGGEKVTATTENGVCEVVSFDGKTAGSRILVRF